MTLVKLHLGSCSSARHDLTKKGLVWRVGSAAGTQTSEKSGCNLPEGSHENSDRDRPNVFVPFLRRCGRRFTCTWPSGQATSVVDWGDAGARNNADTSSAHVGYLACPLAEASRSPVVNEGSRMAHISHCATNRVLCRWRKFFLFLPFISCCVILKHWLLHNQNPVTCNLGAAPKKVRMLRVLLDQ